MSENYNWKMIDNLWPLFKLLEMWPVKYQKASCVFNLQGSASKPKTLNLVVGVQGQGTMGSAADESGMKGEFPAP
jgi:hypothetical protein